MLTRLEAYRYKCFRQMAVDVGAYNVIAGPNGSGKTTLLDLAALLGELIAAQRISDPFLEARPDSAPRAERLSNLVHRNRGDEFILVVESALPDAVRRATDPQGMLTHVRYELRLQVVNDNDLEGLKEYLFAFAAGDRAPAKGQGLQGEPVDRRKLARPLLMDRDWRSIIHRDGGDPAAIFEVGEIRSRLAYRIPPTQLALANVPADQSLFPAAVWFSEFLREGTTFFQPTTNALRRAAAPGRTKRLDETGANVARLAFDLQQSQPDRFQAWVDHVSSALPRVTGVSVQERQDDRYVYLQVRYGNEYDVPGSGLSEGTLRLLALTLLPYLPITPSVLVTEEPENGIHPRAVEAVLLSLQSLYAGQVWISTHSPLVLASTNTDAVLLSVLDPTGEASVIVGSEHERLNDWKGAVDLGTLFAAGVLG
jgi:energy-coupling factor transporter ATP-binding protein EcfA2